MFVRPASDLWRVRDVADRVETVTADLATLQANPPTSTLSGVDSVFHLAAVGVDQAPRTTDVLIEHNILGTAHLLKLAEALRVRRVVYCGSCFEYGPGLLRSEDLVPVPQSVYGASKAAGWLLAQAISRRTGVPVVGLRPFTAYGPYEAPQRLIPYAIARALQAHDLELTAGDQSRDFVYVKDVVEAFLAAAVVPKVDGGLFNVCTGVATTVKDVAAMIVDQTGSRSRLRLGVRPHRVDEIGALSGDPGRARAELSWEARTSLRDGLRQTIQWFRERKPVQADSAATRE